jgi:predicted RNase H-like HicB family nuclease
MDAYNIRFRQEGNAWVVTYQGLELATWGRTLTQARQAAREALAVHLELDSVEALEAAVNLEEDVQLPASLDDTAKPPRSADEHFEAVRTM